MEPAPALYMIRINGHLGATMLSAFPALAPQHRDAHTVLTGLLDQSALYGVLADRGARPGPAGDPKAHAGPRITGTRSQALTLMATSFERTRTAT